MQMTVAQVEKELRQEMQNMTEKTQLHDFARQMGIRDVEFRGMTVDQIKELCVKTELYAFTH